MKWESTPGLCQLHNQLCIVLQLLNWSINMAFKQTQEEFIKRAKSIHGKRFRYNKTKYVDHDTKVIITCVKHGDFLYNPVTHYQGFIGCPDCKAKSIPRNEFLNKAKVIHGYKYDYSNLPKFIRGKVDIKCKEHGLFNIGRASHLRGEGCPKCVGTRNPEHFIEKHKKKHGDLYSYENTKYISCQTPVTVTCKKHGDFSVLPVTHFVGKGCPTCNPKRISRNNYSPIAIRWLEGYSYSHRLKNIQHALNCGEYIIPSTKIRADGYHERSNTVFEFYGDNFHGNPIKYKPHSRPHPFNKNKTAKQLYKDTMQREQTILELGYNLIVIWESDYRSGCKYSYIRRSGAM